MAMQARVRAALRADKTTRGVDITVESDAGKLVLRGIVADAREKDASAAVATAVRALSASTNQLRTMAGSRLFASAKY
jgi:osmotically-inducible protein OsmY